MEKYKLDTRIAKPVTQLIDKSIANDKEIELLAFVDNASFRKDCSEVLMSLSTQSYKSLLNAGRC